MSEAFNAVGGWGKTMTSLDLTKGIEELLGFVAGLQVPGVNMDALVASQRENLQALSTANQAAAAGYQAVAEYQMKILQETMQELTAAIAGLAAVKSPQELVAAETELARKAFETAVRQMRELAQIVTEANQEAAEVIARRIPEGLEEIKDVLKVPQ
ncbi:phasin family protein [uncultured Thiodictyon sp.]|jgi:phasin family protein|uniref:phasin family protein n=1 Tax=uncultured Thiodictyon sp. TaxID=1846217 RepID=UPI0025E715DA|nr:TIGR01841 family phasin [uncultured Thiodictyon sp.]